MLIKKILCPTDLSEDSKASIAYAISLAREHKADLVFFSVTFFPSWELVARCDSDIGFQRRLLMFKVDGLFVSAASRVSNFVQANFGEEICGLSWEARISLGNVSREIIAAAMGMQVDLIVMARRKRGVSFVSWLQAFRLPSVKRLPVRCFRCAHCKSCGTYRRGGEQASQRCCKVPKPHDSRILNKRRKGHS